MLNRTRVLTYFFKSGQDKDSNALYTFEAREQDKNPTVVRDGLYKEDAEKLAGQVSSNPGYFGF